MLLIFVFIISAIIFTTYASALDPATPTDLSAKAYINYIEISWKDANNSFSYTVIEKSSNQGSFYPIATLYKGTNTYKDYGITNGQIYTYRARTFYGSAISQYTKEIEVPFLYPNTFSVQRSLSNEVDLEWTYPKLYFPMSPNQQVVIERRPYNANTWSIIAQLPYGETSYKDSSVESDSLYFYRISALFEDGQHSYFVPSEWGISTRTAYPLTTALTGYAVSENSIFLEWDISKADGGTVLLEKMNVSGDFNTIYSTASANSYIDSGLIKGNTYTYRLRLQSRNGSLSSYTEQASIITETVPFPASFEAVALSDDRIFLSWSYPHHVETGFEVWRYDTNSWDLIATLSKNTETFIDTGVLNGESYVYKIRAIRGDAAFSDFSAEKVVDNTQPPIPGPVVYYSSSSTLYLFSSEPVPSKTTYTLEYRDGINNVWNDFKTVTSGTLVSTININKSSVLYFRIRADRGNLYSTGPEFCFFGITPDPVQDLHSESLGFGGVVLSWSDLSTNEEGYHIYRTVDGNRQFLGRADKDITRFSDISPKAGKSALYEVLSYNASGQSRSVSVTVTVPEVLKFKDIGPFKWADEAINNLLGNGALEYGSGYFNPLEKITLGKLMRIILVSFNIPYDLNGLFTLPDVSFSHPYYKDLMTAVSLGIIYTDDSGNINADRPVTRKEIILILNNALHSLDVPLNTYDIDNFKQFEDYYNITDEESYIVSSFVGDSIIDGDSKGNLNLESNASKAEAVTIVFRTLKKYITK